MNAREGQASDTSQTESVQPVRQDALLILPTSWVPKVQAEPAKLVKLLEETFECDDLSKVDTPLSVEASEKLLYRVCAAYGVRGWEVLFGDVLVQEAPWSRKDSTFARARDRLRAGHYVSNMPDYPQRQVYVERYNVFHVAESQPFQFKPGRGLLADCSWANKMPEYRSYLIVYYLHRFVEEACVNMSCFSPVPWALMRVFSGPLYAMQASLMSVFIREGVDHEGATQITEPVLEKPKQQEPERVEVRIKLTGGASRNREASIIF